MDYDPIASFYDLNYEHYTQDIPFYTKLAEDYGGPVLELGAGTGRITHAIARKGIEVVALEPSAQMRKLGKQKTKGMNVEWVDGDMRSFKFRKKFNLIIAPFNALMHLYTLDDQDKTLECVVKHLAPGGRFAFDLYNPANIGTEHALRHEGDYPGDISIFIHQEHNPLLQALTTNYLIDKVDSKGNLKRQREMVQQRYFTRYEIERWLRAYGFHSRIFGGYFGEPLEGDSPSFAVVAGIKSAKL